MCCAASCCTPQDIDPGWDSIVKILEYNVGLSRFAGPDRGWNDLDMLYGEVGGRGDGVGGVWSRGQHGPLPAVRSSIPEAVPPLPAHVSTCLKPLLGAAVGNPGLQLWPQEERTHFALWSLFKSPLMIGHDLRGMNHTSLEVLKSEVRGLGSSKLVRRHCCTVQL